MIFDKDDQSFTIRSAIMVDAWKTELKAADMFTLLEDDVYSSGQQ